MLESLSERWNLFLDLYAGTGSVGIEALSRGTEWVDFVEQNRACCTTIRENLQRTGFQDQAQVHCCSVASALTHLDKTYDIVIMDPPYADDSVGATLQNLTDSSLVDPASTIVVHHCSRQTLPSEAHDFHIARTRRYGDSHITIYQRRGDQ